MNTVIDFQNVTKIYRDGKPAVDHLSLQIKQGTAVALLGPNGAGKSTSISMMLGLTRPTSGNVKLFDGIPGSRRIHQKVGVMLQGVNVPDRLTVIETIHLLRSFYSDPYSTNHLLKIANLEKEANTLSSKLSGGQMRRLQFALALTGRPDVLFLDEPTVGMDFTSKQHFWQELRHFIAEGKTLLLTTHDLHEADSICDRIMVINHGKIVADDTPERLKMIHSGRQVSFVLENDVSEEILKQLPGVKSIRQNGRQLIIHTTDSDQLIQKVIKENWKITDIQVFGGGLDDAYANLIRETEETI